MANDAILGVTQPLFLPHDEDEDTPATLSLPCPTSLLAVSTVSLALSFADSCSIFGMFLNCLIQI